jgi:hypothetical protein
MRRSNKPLTQQAVKLLDEFMLGKLEPSEHEFCNTKVECTESKSAKTISVSLFDSQIINLSLSLPDEQPFYLSVGLGEYFDGYGCPTRTTVERLNGLLDCLGFHGVIPEGVRVFRDSIEDIFYLGKGDNKIAVGKRYAKNIMLQTDPEDFIVQTSDMVVA